MLETLREVRAEEYRALWRRVPGTVGTTLWIVLVAVKGWEAAWWHGLPVFLTLTVLTRLLPSSWHPVKWLVDLTYPTLMPALVNRILWILLVAHLWLVQGYGLMSVPMVVALLLSALLVPFLIGRGGDYLLKMARWALR